MIYYSGIPKSTEEAIKDKKWYEAVKTEYNSLVENNFWDLVDNHEIKAIGSRWQFVLKRGTSREIVRYKAILVAEDLSQVPGRDYSENCSPTARLSTIRILISYAPRKGSELKQIDIETAYLNGDMKRCLCSKLRVLKYAMSKEAH